MCGGLSVDADERPVRRRTSGPRRGTARSWRVAAAVAGREDAAGHRHQVRREHDRGRAAAAELLERRGHLRHVGVLEQTVGGDVFVDLGEAERAAAAAAGAADAALGVDDDAVGLDQLAGQRAAPAPSAWPRGSSRGWRSRVDSADLVWPDVGQAVGPTLDVAMIAADVDDLASLRDAGQRLGAIRRWEATRTARRAAGRFAGIPLLDHQVAELGRTPGNRSTSLWPACSRRRRRRARKAGWVANRRSASPPP